jgi:hypothetical protein
MADRIKYKKKYKEAIKPLGIGDPLLGAGLTTAGGGRVKKQYPTSRVIKKLDKIGEELGGVGYATKRQIDVASPWAKPPGSRKSKGYTKQVGVRRKLLRKR